MGGKIKTKRSFFPCLTMGGKIKTKKKAPCTKVVVSGHQFPFTNEYQDTNFQSLHVVVKQCLFVGISKVSKVLDTKNPLALDSIGISFGLTGDSSLGGGGCSLRELRTPITVG
jgi:hypothetical protein